MWVAAAVLSAVFAGITAILSKCGVKNTPSNAATAVRTSVVLLFSWGIAFATGEYRGIAKIDAKSWTFLILSGAATGASWLCYFKALSVGDVSKVAAADKSSVVLSVLFAVLLFADERKNVVIKLCCLVPIGVGTLLMADIKTAFKKRENSQGKSWLFFALLSAVFAAATSILAKAGIQNVNSNLATAIRTCIVFVFAWAIVVGKKEGRAVVSITKKDALFLVLSGIATGASWLCYYYAVQNGQISVVVPVDKLSILITVLFSAAVLKERLSKSAWIGLALLATGTVFMAVLT